jgi:hypothetical protein
MNWFPLLLALHIGLAVALLAPSLLLPFLLRRADAAGGPPSHPVTRLLMAMQGTGSVAIAVGLALTGAGLLAVLGLELLGQPWLLVALVIYAGNLLLAILVSRPNLRHLLNIQAGDDGTWRRRARQQRYLAYAMAATIGVIGLLMRTKPTLW